MFESLLNNQFFTAGALIGAAAYIRELPLKAFEELKEQVLTQLIVEDQSDYLSGLKEWIAKRLITKRFRQIFESGQIGVAPGTYFAGFFHKTPFWVNFSRTETKGHSYSDGPSFRDKYTLTFLTRNLKILDLFSQELLDLYQLKTRKDIIRVYFIARDGGLNDHIPIKKRPLESVVLPNSLRYDIVQDLENFKAKEDWYHSVGVPYRRGYMLYGPPGNGKSSLVASLAGKFDACLKVINLSSLDNDSALQYAFNSVKDGDFVLLEDADCITREGFSNFSLSTLLNVIDGVGARDGRILFLTTNKPDQLDEALVRPGRLDRKFHIQNATKEQAYQLYYRFFGKAPDHLTIEDFQYSMAELQEKFLEEAMNDHNR